MSITKKRALTFAIVAAASAVLFGAAVPAVAQQRALGLDISAWQGNISQTTWNNIRNVESREFVFIRSSRGGTTGYDHLRGGYPSNNNTAFTLSQRYDDPYFVQNINRATAAGMYAGAYHFGRMDIIASTENTGGIPNNGTDEANHFIQQASPWMRPGYLLPVFDFEAGSGARTATQLAQFSIDFSNRIYDVMGIRPAVYIGNNYASPMNSISLASAVVAAYPTLWTARWPNQTDPDSIPVHTAHPGNYTSTVYGPWDNSPNPTHPWGFWQYASTGRLQSFNNGNSNLDFDVAQGGVEFLKDHLVPALWVNNSSGDWSTLANWNSGQTPVAPPGDPNVQSCGTCPVGTTGQLAPIGTQTLPTARLPGAAGSGVTSGQHDTVILDRPNANITVTVSSGSHNIRKLFVGETLNITGGSLNINYVPTYDGNNNLIHYVGTDTPAWEAKRIVSAHASARFGGAVTLSGSASLSVHSLQIDATRTFTLAGGNLTFNRIALMPHASTPAKIAVTGNVNFNPLANATATIGTGAGSGASGLVDLGGGTRIFNVGNGSAAVDLAVNVPIVNGGLTKAGLGTLALNAVNSYAGDTRVQAGKLSIAHPFLANSSSVYLSSGSLLDLNFSGTDTIESLFFDGFSQAIGTWGAAGSGAQHTSSLFAGIGLLNITGFIPPPQAGPGNVLDHFEVDEGHFSWPYNHSPSSQTFGLASSTTIDRVVGERQGPGAASQLLNLVITEEVPLDPTWELRHNSGIGTAASPAANVPLASTGYAGFWLKTDEAGISVQLAIDDPVPGGSTAIEKGIPLNVIADNQWHLYQWNLEDEEHWLPFNAGSNGAIDAVSGIITIDSIFFAGSGNAQIYLDNVSHNPDGPLAALIPGDYDRNGLVEAADYNAWQAAFGQSVPAGTSADGNGDGIVNMGDYLVWRKRMSGGGAAALSAPPAVPEPASLLLVAVAAIAMVAFSRSTIGRPNADCELL